MHEVRTSVEARLHAFLEDKRQETQQLSEESVELVDAVRELTLRGGKRARPIVMAAGYHAVGGGEAIEPLVDAGAALELLQSYLLIHDDWMDQDDERRGGPAAHVALAKAHQNEHLGASLAILAGDLASAYASELISEAPFPDARRAAGLRAFWRIQREVFFGQHLDLIASPDVDRMYDLKTGSYTVRGPLIVGALLAGASEAQLEALRNFAYPLGIAFQLRDELLGTFGDSNATGKPSGNDLRAGKLTHLVSLARTRIPAEERAPLEAVFGCRNAAQEKVNEATTLLESCGARQSVEERLDTLRKEASEALETASFKTERLTTVAALLTDRNH
ncbi:MAG: polyprenyl synthetase family protein [Myxococcota bacterium]